MASGEEGKISSGWTKEATAKVEAEADTWCSWVAWQIDADLVWATPDNANDENQAYRSEIIDRQSRIQSRDSEVVMGSLIDGGD